MKIRIIFIILLSVLMINIKMGAQTTSKKILVAYFSHSGNTRVIAQYIKEITGADIFEIIPVNQYTTDYNTLVNQAKKEINADYKPALKTKVANIEQYDIIFIGSPNWWSTFAPPVATFMSSYNFSGKTIIPFITHEGSRMGRSVNDLKKLCPRSIVMNGYDCRGSNVKNARNEVSKWLKEIKIIR